MGLPYAEPATFLAIRFFAVATILAVVAWITGAPWPDNQKDKARIAAVGLLVHGIYLGGIFGGISLGVTAGDSALIVGMQPVLTAVLVGPVLGETVRARQWSGFVIGTAGVTLVSWRYIDNLDSTLTGVTLCVVAVMGMIPMAATKAEATQEAGAHGAAKRTKKTHHRARKKERK